MYEGCNASGGLLPSVYAGFNALAESCVKHRKAEERNQSFERPFKCLDFCSHSFVLHLVLLLSYSVIWVKFCLCVLNITRFN